MLEMKLATCEAVMGVLPESTDSLKTSYLSRESTYRLVIVDFGLSEVRYAFYTYREEQNRYIVNRGVVYCSVPS